MQPHPSVSCDDTETRRLLEFSTNSEKSRENRQIAVVIPCYRVTQYILDVLSRIGPEVDLVFVVDDKCPENTKDLVRQKCSDPRVHIIEAPQNLGVGGATMLGYRAAMEKNADVIVKIDGDGQMDPALIGKFITPILKGAADYTKGNRFYFLENLQHMPRIRLLGNAVLSLMSKLSTGYWHIFDPTNGYTAISGKIVALLPMDKISKRYFFESDLLFRLNTLQAMVVDIPMKAIYASEESNLYIRRILFEFLAKHSRNYLKRLFYSYFLRNFSVASLELVAGVILLALGVISGSVRWLHSITYGVPATSGQVMLAALPLIFGFQLLLSFLSYDINSTPRSSIQSRL